MHGVSTGAERLNLDEQTIADVFQAAGYATGAFGKWHNGTQSPYHPNDRGFDEYYGFCSGHWGEYFDPELDHNGSLVRGNGYLPDACTDRALTFIERHRDRPFFCYVPFNTPHSPMQVPEAYWKKFVNKELTLRAANPAQEDVPKTRAALAMCENLDANVGRILKKLDELNLAEDTIVVYFSDNGPNGARWNGGMKGQKGSLDEGGVRSPLLVRWPGQIRPKMRVASITAAIDLLPTLADLAGVRLENPKPLDGVSLKPQLLANVAVGADRKIYTFWNGKISVRTPRFRLDPAGRMYDMIVDPTQQRDISGEHPQVAASLALGAEQTKREFLVELGKDDRPFTVGYSRSTPLPARDGVAHGNVQRSAPAPNCSFFTRWTSPEDRITWDIEVAQEGRYEAVVSYTCPAVDMGSTVELAFHDSRIAAKVSEAHDPPLRGAENDRVPRRGESYVKDFKPLRLGVLPLRQGRGRLTLRALDVPGKQVMDVRRVVLTRVE